ncbi:MAG: DegT/DnrJ/EryC1/StrS family aminotransferase [Methanocellales archaeon]|nr:DegT/DnrJ/EryC1/StrS family aminotransferase [Methanocellales archaeon]MDD4897831.1 DegT/DnrJ/EryC1/StrS family aminotransferase [Methanocellales archaeon]MDD5446388.1 DegT/DnrJ/EryC1/StrS family aminotransferase [Methanocellales archaeon]
MDRTEIKKKIFELIKEYFDHQGKEDFIPNKTKIGVGFPCYNHKEIISAVDSLLDLRLSQGKKVETFERNFSNYIGCKYGIAVNSGSSANLLAISALLKSGRVKKGCEVITPAATFTTVVSPILQNGLIPTFVDVDKETYNIDPQEIKRALNENTGLILPVHSLGCPADMGEIMEIARENDIPVMEDCCEAHGASINGEKVGTFGLISTYSFFVAHNMTTGEGGIITTDDKELDEILRSIREFGRLRSVDFDKPRFYYSDAWLKEYDERYIFENIGYNVRMTDVTASLGIEQLKKLDLLNKVRVEIAKYFTDRLEKYEDYLQLPKVPENYYHSFYGFPILIKESAPFLRRDIVRFLEEYKIETRAFMGGNLALQPAYRNENIKVIGNLENTIKIMNNAFFIGCYPYIDEIQREYIISVFDNFFEKYL